MCYTLLSRDIDYISFFFFFNDTATTEIYTLSLHDALPICFIYDNDPTTTPACDALPTTTRPDIVPHYEGGSVRSEEHTSELQSQSNLVCRLLLEKKKKKN